MSLGNVCRRYSRTAVVMAGLLTASGFVVAQDKPSTVPDAQVEANVLKALASAPELADQAISSTTVYGTVTLSGSVRDEASRTKAEQLAANAAGVKKVVDELVIGAAPAPSAQVSQPADDAAMNQQQGSNPNLQSDGTMAPPANGNQDPNMQQQGPPQNAPYRYPQGQPVPQNQGQQQPYPQNAPYGYPQGQPGPQAQGQPAYPPPPYRRYPYGPPPAYAQPAQPVIQQQAGQTVVVPSGTVLTVRINQALDSQKTQPGTAFDGVMLSDVIVGNQIAIPRGASVQGVVGDVRAATPLRGRGGLALQLTQVTLEGATYPLATGDWTQAGVDKTGRTVGNTVGLGATGAAIGGIVGGGPGALLGAGIGAVAGLGVSSTGSGAAKIPAEAILNFKLTQQTPITTVSQAELDRLGAGLPQPSRQLQRRYAYPAYPAGYPPPPPPPGYYYGRGYYPYYAYPYPYYGYYR